MTFLRPLVLAVLCASVVAGAQSADRDVLVKIRAEGLERSQAPAVFDYLTINIGPRLTASPAHKRAAEWTRDRLVSYGLSNVHLEPWSFGRGWELQKLTLEMIEPRYLPLIGYADAWSPATSGEIVAAPAFVGGKSPEEIAAMGASLKGAIVHGAADDDELRAEGSSAAERSASISRCRPPTPPASGSVRRRRARNRRSSARSGWRMPSRQPARPWC